MDPHDHIDEDYRDEGDTFHRGEAIELPVELAMIRWSVVHMKWDRISSGNMPYLPAFLAGWFSRSIGATHPENVGQYRDSFMAGWKEAREQAVIASR